MNERTRFAEAFNACLLMGEKPTPTRLNALMDRKGHVLPGRLSKLRRQMFRATGWTQAHSPYGHTKHWKAPRHPQNARVHV